MAVGRPTKLTPELQAVLVEAIAAGNYYQAACARAGVGYQTFMTWMAKGKKQRKGCFREFRDAILGAKADAELTIVADWRAQTPTSWQAARDFLARRFPERWAQRETLKLLRQAAKEANEMTDEELRALRQAECETSNPQSVSEERGEGAGGDADGVED